MESARFELAQKSKGLCSRSSLQCKQSCHLGQWGHRRLDQRHHPSGQSSHLENTLLTIVKHTREPSGRSREDMAAFPWRLCGPWAPLVRRKEEALVGWPDDAGTPFHTKVDPMAVAEAFKPLPQGWTDISTWAQPGVNLSSGHCSCSCHPEGKASLESFCLRFLHCMCSVSRLHSGDCSKKSSEFWIKLSSLRICVEIPPEDLSFFVCVTNSLMQIFLKILSN